MTSAVDCARHEHFGLTKEEKNGTLGTKISIYIPQT
jgi:hypothetical protein